MKLGTNNCSLGFYVVSKQDYVELSSLMVSVYLCYKDR